MRPRDLQTVRDIASKVEAGKATSQEWQLFLINIRDELPKDPNNQVWDMANFVAHPNRDRGHSFKHVQTFKGNFFDAVSNGGNVVLSPPFPTVSFIESLTASVSPLGLQLDYERVVEHMGEMKTALGEMLDGTQVLVRDPRVT